MAICHQKVIEVGAKIDHESHQKLRRKTTRTNTENKTSSEQKRHETERARSGINTKNHCCTGSKRKPPFRIEAPAERKRLETPCQKESQSHRV